MSNKKKDKYITKKLSDNIYYVALAVNQAPVIKVDQSKGIIKFGKDNNYPEYELFLYNNSPSHGAIVNGKARYLTGTKLKPKEPNPQAELWLKNANKKGESFLDLFRKQNLDDCISGMDYILIHPNLLFQPTSFIHLDFAKCRLSECYNFVEYSEDWSDLHNNPIKCYPVWYEGIKQSAVYINKRYSPTSKKVESAYAKPEWMAATLDIDTDVEVNTFFNALVKNNFSAGTIVTIFSGKIPKSKQDEIREGLVRDNTQTHNAGTTIVSFANEDSKGAEVANLNANDLDKQYQEVSKRNLQNILIGHGVSPVLFKLQTPGTLGQRTELIAAHELFLNEYVIPKQVTRLDWLSKMYKLRFGVECEFEFEQVETIGIDYTDANISKFLTADEIREKLNLPKIEKSVPMQSEQIANTLNSMSPLLATKVLETMTSDEIRSLAGLPPKTVQPVGADGKPVAVQTTQVNEHLKNMTGRQMQGLMRIVKKYDDEQLTYEQALLLMQQSFGISAEEAKTFLNIADEETKTADTQIQQCAHHFKSEKDKLFFALLSKYSHPINKDDEVLEVEYMDATKVHMAVAVTDIRNSILQKIIGGGTSNPEQLAGEYGIEKSSITKALEWLTGKGFLEEGENGHAVTDKGINKGEGAQYRTEIYTEFTYQLRPEYKGKRPLIIPTSHQFCKDMVALTQDRALSYEYIDSLNNDFGENAFDYRGGFTNFGNKGGIKPWCYHVWEAQTKVRKVKL